MLYMINLLLSIGIGIALGYYFNINTPIAIVVCFAVLTIVNGGLFEGYTDSPADDSRIIKYGDSIALWTWTNSYLQGNDTKDDVAGAEENKTHGTVGLSARLPSPEDIPKGWIHQFWTIEDANDPHGGPGNRGSVKFGDQVYLRSWRATYLRADESKGILQSTDRFQRGANEQFTIESPDISGSAGSPVKYGDMCYLKTWRGTYLAIPEGSTVGVQSQEKGKEGLIRVYDHYGEGSVTDWARRGFATQSSTVGNYPASNVLDGNVMTFSHTQAEQGAWLQVRLPKDVLVDTIYIKNRVDCCQERIKNFDVILITDSGQEVMRKNFTNVQPEYTINGVNRTGRTVKIQLRSNTQPLQPLHVSEVRVYGKGVDYSTLLENPVVTEIVSQEIPITETSGKTFYSDDLPYIGSSNSASLSCFVKLADNNDGVRVIYSKGGMPTLQSNNGTLEVIVATNKIAQLKVPTSQTIKTNEWTHVGVVVKDGISPKTGWIYGEFNVKPAGSPGECCYALHPQLKQYYYLRNAGVFADVQKNTWDQKMSNTMHYMGELDASVVSATLDIYINGKRDVNMVLDGRPLFNKLPLILGSSNSDKGANCAINEFKFYNYAVSSNIIQKDSSFAYENSIFDLVRGEHDAEQIVTVEPHLLPRLTDKCSIGFWIYSDRDDTGTRKWDMVFVKGNREQDRAPAMFFHPTNNQLSAPVSNIGGSYWGDGVETVKTPIAAGAWYHITETLDGKTQTIYVNGKMVDQVTLPGPVIFTVSPIKIGGFAGKIKDFRLYNFVLSADEVMDYMGRHPDYKYQQMVTDIWNKSGCVSQLFEDDPSAHANWVKLMKSGDSMKLEQTFNNLRAKADTGDKDSQALCYGSHTSKLYQSLANKDELLKYALDNKNGGKKCLPNAPFNCKVNNVNDFDIRTHRDFYKYTLTGKIIPCAQSPSDYKLEDHPDFPAFKKQLDETANSLRQMNLLRTQSENKNSELTAKMTQLTSQKGLTETAVKNSQVYKDLLAEMQSEEEHLTKIKQQQNATQSALLHAQEAANISTNPQYVQMATDLKNARKVAAANIAKSMNPEELEKSSMFKNILDNMLKSSGSDEGVLSLSDSLRRQQSEMNQIRSQTLIELNNTRKMANDVLTGVAGLTPEMIKNIIASKENLSENPEYNKIIQQVKGYCNNVDIQEHPEYVNLVKKLNNVTQSEVESGNIADLTIQANKCRALFENSEEYNSIVSSIPDSVLLNVIKNRMNDSKFQPFVKNILQSVSDKDSNLRDILARAQEEGRSNDPAYQDFIEKIIKEQILKNPVYRETLVRMIENSEYGGTISSQLGSEYIGKNYRIEDHPEYNQFAREMRSQCNVPQSGYEEYMRKTRDTAEYGQRPRAATSENLSCFSCKLK